jgi:diguanylate cyclase (GGDEF)-like protein
MAGAVVLLAVNAAVAGLFAACYFLIALVGGGRRPVHAFGISYLIGMATPLAELAVRLEPHPAPYMIVSYGALLGGFLAMSAALSRFARRAVHWRWIAAIALAGLVVRVVIWGGHRDYLPYEMAYQAPFVAALLLCAHTAYTCVEGRLPRRLLAGLFGTIALNFLVKPFAAAWLGSGATARDYAASFYALYSQASTGILLIAAGLVVLLVVMETAVRDYTRASETDHLSGLLNRRGFDRLAQARLVQAGRAGGTPERPAVIMVDLDHFKQINDTHGHEAGDRVITHFGALLRQVVPAQALIARTGGEEFVVLLDDAALAGGARVAEAIRRQVACGGQGVVPFTLSAGVAEYCPGDGLATLMRRADQAVYRAKQQGRDRVIAAGMPDRDAPPARIAAG